MSFAPRVEYGDLDLTDVPYMVEWGFDGGSPVTLYEAIASLMVDGSHQSSPGHGNRENLRLTVIIEAPDAQERARLGEDLELEAGKPFNELRFYPGDDIGEVTVLETYPAGVSHDWNTDLEQTGLRRYVLTIPALPFARALNTETINWTEIGTKLDTLASTTGWTVSGGGTVSTFAGGFNFTSTTITLTKTFTIDRDFLWVASGKGSPGPANGRVGALSGVTIDGTAIDIATVSPSVSMTTGAVSTGDRGGQQAVDVSAWNGQTVSVALTFTYDSNQGSLYALWSVDYPVRTQVGPFGVGVYGVRPLGIGVIDVKGSARTPCRLSFTAPTGGAFVYTGPDPARSIRDYGAGEVVFAHFTVAAGGTEIAINDWVTWFPEGTHSTMIGFTEPQPVEINPNGVWPQAATGTEHTAQYAYPQDRRASVSFFETSGAKNLISPSPRTPQGYVGDAVHHEPHALHPDRCGFAVLDINGAPIATTIEYYPRNWIHAAH